MHEDDGRRVRLLQDAANEALVDAHAPVVRHAVLHAIVQHILRERGGGGSERKVRRCSGGRECAWLGWARAGIASMRVRPRVCWLARIRCQPAVPLARYATQNDATDRRLLRAWPAAFACDR